MLKKRKTTSKWINKKGSWSKDKIKRYKRTLKIPTYKEGHFGGGNDDYDVLFWKNSL